MALFCDATLLVLGPCETDGSGDLTTSGHARALAVAEHVRERRIARVAGGTTGASSVTASALADALDVPVWLLPDLDRGTDGWADAVQSIADQHRGETVVVVAAHHDSDDAVVTELLIGDDGWREVPPVTVSVHTSAIRSGIDPTRLNHIAEDSG